MADDWSTSLQNFLQVGDLTTGFIDIGADVPAELQQFYTDNHGATVVRALIRWVLPQAANPSVVDYYYMLTATAGDVSRVWATGWVDYQKNVLEQHFTAIHDQPPFASIVTLVYGQTIPINVFYGGPIGNVSVWSWTVGSLQQEFGTHRFFNASELVFDDGVTITYNGVDQPRGRTYYETVTVPHNSGAAAGTESLVFTTAGSMFLEDGRAYGVRFMNAKLKSLALQQAAYALRETNLAGTLLVSGPRFGITTVNIDFPFQPYFIFINSSGADVTTTLAFTITPQVATLVTLDAGVGANAWGFEVVDLGAASAYPGAISIV